MKTMRIVLVSLLLCAFSGVMNAGEDNIVRILAIGNSFSEDAVEFYLHDIAAADGNNVIIGNMYIGGCSLKKHLDNARENKPAYKYRKIGLDGKKTETRDFTLEQALADEQWDYVSFQQQSGQSGMYDTWKESLPALVEYVKARVPENAEMMLHQTWAYAASSTHKSFKKYGSDQVAMYNAIVDAVKMASKLTKIRMIIPSGTAVQNARNSIFEDNLTRDGYHLHRQYGRYTVACTWYETLFSKCVIGNAFLPKGMTSQQCLEAQKAAHAAVRKPHKVTKDPDHISIAFAGTPPRTAYPWVWWHWIDGNISKNGIRKDLLWMHEIGIAGLHQFDAAKSGVPQLVPEKIPYMSQKWKDAFRYAMELTDSLGIEVGIASSPGWSSTGGPWVKPEDAMKKLVWRTVEVSGGDRVIELPEPFAAVGFYQDMANFRNVEPWYRDVAVVAVRIPENDRSLKELGAEVSSSEGDFTLDMLTDGLLSTCSSVTSDQSKGDAWVQYTFSQPQTFKAVTVAGEALRLEWDREPAQKHLILECSEDNVDFREVTRIPDSFVYTKTIDFPATAARYWRLRILPSRVDRHHLREFVLHTVTKVNNVDKKAGFAAHYDFMQLPTPESPDAVRDVVVLDLPDENGNLHVNLPEGDWRICRFGQSLTGKKNHPAAKHATGLEVDKLDPQAWMGHFRKYLDMYMEASGGRVGQKGVQYILTDSYEARQMTWTRNMAKEFAARNGYDLLRWLPALTGEIIDSSQATEKFLWDWRNTIGDLFAENYDRINDIVEEYGMRGRYTESQGGGRTFVGDGMDVKMTAAFPMAEIWMRPFEQLQHNLSDIRESASVAHIFGQNIVPVEAFTANGTQNGGQAYKFCPENMKYVADLAMENGVNRFVIHSSVHQPSDEKVPGAGLFQFGQWFNRHETWADMARPWMDYLARSSYMLQRGTFVADILYYYGEDNCITGLYRKADCLPDIPYGYNFDYINPKGLLQAVSVKKGRLVTETGMSYEVLCLGENCRRMSLKMLGHIVSLAEKGASVCGVLPEEPAGMNDDNETFKMLRDRLQKYMKGGGIANVLAEKGIKPDFSASENDIRYVHRRLPDMDIYWVRNFSDRDIIGQINLRTPGARNLEVWNPENGKQYSIPFTSSRSSVSTTLDMDSGCALFLVVKYRGKAAPAAPAALRQSVKIGGPWTVSFQQGRGAPESIIWNKLIDWTASEDEGIRHFSGTADYTATLNLDEEITGNAVISLGDVRNIARVIVNGTECGIAWKAPFTVDIPAGVLKVGKNEVSVTVANLWVNRIVGDLQPDCRHKFTATPRAFYNADSPLLPSGLLGPVELKY